VSRILVVNGIGDTLLSFRGPLIRDLVQRGHQVVVSTPAPEWADTTALRAAVESLGAELVYSPLARTSLNPFRERRAIAHWRELIQDRRPDAVLASNPKPVFHLPRLARDANVPRRVSMITGLGYAFIDESMKARLLRRVACRLYRSALLASTAILFQNDDDREEFRQRGLLPEGVPVETIGGSGVDLHAFPERPVPTAPPCFLMVSRLLGDKGVREFAAAARIVRATRKDCRFRLVGWIDGNPAAIRREELDSWVRDGDLEWAGRLDDVRSELAGATAFVLPSYREGTPRSTLEALATGRAVITTDVPGCRATVVDGENGLLIAPRDANALARACLWLAEHPERLVSMGRASRALAERRFDVKRVNETVIRLLE
jgi:glycosyltransferase involved in cell wall biosynthesis